MTTADDIAKQFKRETELIEKNFKSIFLGVRSYLKALQRAKKKNEIIITHLKEYAQLETEEIRSSILGFASQMENVNKNRQNLYDRIDLKVFEKLGSYHNKCKKNIELVEKRSAVTKKRTNLKENLNKIQKNNTNSYEVQKAQSMLSEAEAEEARVTKELYAGIENFEREKVRDIKFLCSEYIHSEIAYHAQCLEAMTNAFVFFETVSEDKEVKHWLRRLHPNNSSFVKSSDSQGTPEKNSKRDSSFDSPYKTPRANQTKNRSNTDDGSKVSDLSAEKQQRSSSSLSSSRPRAASTPSNSKQSIYDDEFDESEEEEQDRGSYTKQQTKKQVKIELPPPKPILKESSNNVRKEIEKNTKNQANSEWDDEEEEDEEEEEEIPEEKIKRPPIPEKPPSIKSLPTVKDEITEMLEDFEDDDF